MTARRYRPDEPEAAEVHPGLTLQKAETDLMTINRYAFDGGARFPLHRHPEEQAVYVVEGAITFTTADAAYELQTGDLLTIPADLPHEAEAAPGGARVVSVVTPRRTAEVSYVPVP